MEFSVWESAADKFTSHLGGSRIKNASQSRKLEPWQATSVASTEETPVIFGGRRIGLPLGIKPHATVTFWNFSSEYQTFNLKRRNQRQHRGLPPSSCDRPFITEEFRMAPREAYL